MFALILGSVFIVGWSYYKWYLPPVLETREVSATVAKLTAQVEELDHRWSKADSDQVNRQFETAQARFFADQAALAAWLADFREQGTPLGLNIRTDLGKPVVAKSDLSTTNAILEASLKFTIIPTTIAVTFQPLPIATDQPSRYQRLLQLAQHLTDQEKIADLTELTVDSDTNSIGRAILGFNFLAGTKEAK